MNDHFPYSISEPRPLREPERDLLSFLLSREAPGRKHEIDSLQVRARCGCGRCPTVMFHDKPEKDRSEERILADYQGGNPESGLIGIILWERAGRLSELEAWSIDGSDVEDWPDVGTLRPFSGEGSTAEPGAAWNRGKPRRHNRRS